METQPEMLSALNRRARKAGVANKIELCLAGAAGLGVGFWQVIDPTM